MDFLDIVNGRFYHTQTGGFYKRLPQVKAQYTAEDLNGMSETERVPFDYETVNMQEWRYQQLIRNLVDVDASTVVIKARIDVGFAVGTHVTLWQGGLYRITNVVRDTSQVSKEAFYVLPIPLGTEYILTLTEVENTWGLA